MLTQIYTHTYLLLSEELKGNLTRKKVKVLNHESAQELALNTESH